MIKWLIKLFRRKPECRAVQWYDQGHIDPDLAERISKVGRMGFTCEEFLEGCKRMAKMGFKI